MTGDDAKVIDRVGFKVAADLYEPISEQTSWWRVSGVIEHGRAASSLALQVAATHGSEGVPW